MGIWTGGVACALWLVDLTVDPEERVNLLLGEEEGKKDPQLSLYCGDWEGNVGVIYKGGVPALYTNQADPQSNPLVVTLGE